MGIKDYCAGFITRKKELLFFCLFLKGVFMLLIMISLNNKKFLKYVRVGAKCSFIRETEHNRFLGLGNDVAIYIYV